MKCDWHGCDEEADRTVRYLSERRVCSKHHTEISRLRELAKGRTEKECSQCKQTLPMSDFGVEYPVKNGVKYGPYPLSKCKECANAAGRAKNAAVGRKSKPCNCGKRFVQLNAKFCDECRPVKPKKEPPSPWAVRCKAAASDLVRQQDPWSKRCNNAVTCLRMRPNGHGVEAETSRRTKTWWAAINKGLRDGTHQLDAWSRKIANTQTSLSRRARRQKQRTSGLS